MADTYTLDKDLILSGSNTIAITVNASNVVIDLTGFTLSAAGSDNQGSSSLAPLPTLPSRMA